MKKLMVLAIAGLLSNVAIADSSDPLGTGAANSDPADLYVHDGAMGEFAKVDYTDPLGTGAANSDEVWDLDVSGSTSVPQVGDSESDDIFGLYETSDVL